MSMSDVNDIALELTASARECGMWISGDGRVGEADLAALLGFSSKSLANMRSAGEAPPSYKPGGQGHRVTYRLTDVAAWIEDKRQNDSI